MAMVKRIFLFLAINLLVVVTLSFILNLFNVGPFLTSYGLDIQQLMLFCFIWGMGGAFISLSLSRILAKWLMGVQVIDPNTQDPELRRLLSTVYTLSRTARLPDMPQVGIYESLEVNAFATGPTKRRALVAVSRGLLRRMSEKELEGVLAHEITHISNGDMVTMTLIQGIVNAFVMFLARILAYALSGSGRNRQQSSSFQYMMLVFLFEVVFMIFGSLVIATFSRRREFRADAGGSDLAGKDKMIAALEALQTIKSERVLEGRKSVFQSMKISNRGQSGFLRLFASHPPLEERIQRLKA